MAGFRLFGARAKIQKAKKMGNNIKKNVPSLKKYQKIITSNDQVVDHGHEADHAKHFTDFCALCEKDIKGKNAFMYGYLQAFCSPECRDSQIALDDNKDVKPSSSTKTNGNGNGPAAQIEAKAKLVIPTPHHQIKTGAILKPAAAAGGGLPNKSKRGPSCGVLRRILPLSTH